MKTYSIAKSKILEGGEVASIGDKTKVFSKACKVIDAESKAVIAILIKKVLPENIIHVGKELKRFRGWTKMLYNYAGDKDVQSQSSTVGYIVPYFVKDAKPKLSRATKTELDFYNGDVKRFASYMDGFIKKYTEEEYERCLRFMETVPEKVRLSKVSTNLQIEYNSRGRFHTNNGNYNNYSVYTPFNPKYEKYSGGEIVYGEYDIAFDVEEGDVLIMNNKEFYGTAPVKGTKVCSIMYIQKILGDWDEYRGTGLKKKLLLELFCGTKSVGNVARKMDYEVISLDLDEKSNPDILANILDWEYKNLKLDPDVIWASPPCETFSVLTNSFKNRPRTKTHVMGITYEGKLGDKILDKTIEIIKYFASKNPNMYWIIENPMGYMRAQRSLRDSYLTTTTYCNYDDDRYKPTDFFNNFGLDLIPVCSASTTKTKDHKHKLISKISNVKNRHSIPESLIQEILEQVSLKNPIKVDL